MSDELPGAREELERDGASLCEQILDLARELTPEQLPTVDLRDPRIVDWHEPLQYQYRVHDYVDRPVELNTPDFIERAAAFMAGQGWAVESGPAPVVGSTPVLQVAGTRDGFQVTIRIQEGQTGVLYLGRTAARPLYVPDTFVPPPPEKTAETVDPGYVLCYECLGRGWCPLCRGRGWITDDDGRTSCPECRGQLGCPICHGHGQRTIIDPQ